MNIGLIQQTITPKLIARYLLQGLGVAIAAYYIPIMFKISLRKPTINEIFYIGLSASIIMYILDSITQPELAKA